MIVRLQRLRDRGRPIPKYQHAFKSLVQGELLVVEERDAVLNRYTRIAKLIDPRTCSSIGIPPLLDAQIVKLTREFLALSGIERIEDLAIRRIEDFAQSWICWLGEGDQ